MNNPVSAPRPVLLKDYRAPDYRIDTVDLRFELELPVTRVRARLAIVANHPAGDVVPPLTLVGEGLELVSIALDGRRLEPGAYVRTSEGLTLTQPPRAFTLEIETAIRPGENTALEGLYVSSGNFCTQCEAEGFRRIMYFLDRPDVLARYAVTVVAERSSYPVLLSNGNPVERGELSGGRHFVTWEDPYPKPCYLFALVAGDLACAEDRFTTMYGREVQLQLYVQHHNLDKTAHALAALKQAMRWDEQVYGREYDLDVFMIVAVDDFNMGAMENKGLNIFNSACVLAKPATATDADYQNIEGIVAHEYFHNWSGNRVTCRDWFQLSLKEGFTVFRDQEFSADAGSRGVARIQDVNALRLTQFREDAGPLAHPVRPDSYVEINNFYTATVYNKGAEVVRMLHHLLGAEGFRRGTDLYFARHDGEAVTTDDFVAALEDANGVDFTRFRRWYVQAGTPLVRVERAYDGAARRLTLTLHQSCAPTPGQPEKLPLHIPVAMGLLGRDGRELPLRLSGESAAVAGTRVLELREASERYVFEDVPEAPVPSLLRGFSAPVRLEQDLSDTEREFLMAHDADPFCRWEAGQQLAVQLLLGAVTVPSALMLPEGFAAACRQTLARAAEDPAFAALALTLPAESYIAEFQNPIDPVAIHAVRRAALAQLALALAPEWQDAYARYAEVGSYRYSAEGAGRRSLRNLALAYLMELPAAAGGAEAERQCRAQFEAADNMTDMLAALAALVHHGGPAAAEALAVFYARFRDDPLVMDKWFAIQATARTPGALGRVQALMGHPAFSFTNPNKLRALIGGFCQGNPAQFHAADGSGYRFLGEVVARLDRQNPQIAARLLTPFSQWRRYDGARAEQMRAELERLAAEPALSRDLREIVSRSLGSD